MITSTTANPWGLLVRDADGQYRDFDQDHYATFEAADAMRRHLDTLDHQDGFGREALVFAVPPMFEIVYTEDTTGDDYAAENRLRLMEGGF